jgi:hypothetical protein
MNHLVCGGGSKVEKPSQATMTRLLELGCQCDAYLITVRPTTLLNMDVRDEVIQVAYEPTRTICLYRAGYPEG